MLCTGRGSTKVVGLAGLHVCLLDLVEFSLTLLNGFLGRAYPLLKPIEVVLICGDRATT